MTQTIHVPTIKKLIQQELGLLPADMTIGRGGFICSEVLWDMKPVALIARAYAGTESDGTPSNMVEHRPRHEELTRIGEMLQRRGYTLQQYDESRDLFFVVPTSEESI